ncbi:hypothetical protein [Achromobacter sp. NFACC18-2]|uniref:hypothetical protein n=1 Tax=Achromobacter sp. NFACC18-2 TaxID=1564112 RepID=UPI0008D707D6|nr:hypothetical protein [Achromobacter sp. NFACC18-2]SEI78634.1 hypothetical protein SAMN03159494_00994 [Achromobacter sp. NFACC18-2]
MSKRNHQVQTPGETPTTVPDGDQVETQATDTTTPAEPAADQAPAPAEKPAEPPKATAKKPAERPDYAKMRAADIDPDAITAPVLSLDGWVIPTPKPATKV